MFRKLVYYVACTIDGFIVQCGEQGVLAFTAVGNRLIFVCGRAFARAAQRDAAEAKATLVHEVLHSIGLGENPPPPRWITYRVKELCW